MKRLCILAILIAFVSKVQSNELYQFKRLRELSSKRAKIVIEKMNELFREQPELKKYVSQPSTRNILQRIRAKKAGRGEVDTVRVLAIRVEFQEHPRDSLATGTGKIRTWRDSTIVEVTSEGDTIKAAVPPFDFTVDTTIINADTIVDTTYFHNLNYDPPHTKRYFEHQLEALRNYWLDNSCGKLYIDFTVAPQAESAAYQLPYQIYYYGDPTNYVQGLLTLLRDALLACDQDPYKTFRMSDYDAYIIFHAGCSWQASAPYIGNSYDIFSAYIRGLDWYFGTPVYVDNGTYPITDGTIMPESDFKYGVASFLQGGLAHEFGHQLGLFDLYDTSGRTIGCGGWALMGTGNWNMNGLLPPHLSAWHAERLGWVRLEEIDKNSDSVDVYFMGGNDCTKTKMYKIPINSNEYFLITNRQVWANPDTTKHLKIYSTDSTLHYDSSGVRVWKDGVLTRFDDYDFGLPPDPTDTLHPTYGGLAIWHIDKSKIAKDSLQNAINAGSPKGVDMEEADGIQDFDMSIVSNFGAAFYGSPWDVFFDGSAASFTPYTLPNTDDNNGAGSHIYIQEISKPDTIMSFSIKFDWQYSNFPIRPGHLFDVNSPAVVEFDGKKLIVCSVMDTVNGGSIFVCKADGAILWQKTLRDTVGNTIFAAAIFSSPAIGDIDGDNTPDVVCGSYFARWQERPPSRLHPADSVIEAWGKVYAWSIYGDGIKGFPVKVNDAIIASPLLADIDGDDAKEIIMGSNDMMLHIWKGDGTPITAINLSQWIWTTPVYDSSSNVIYANSFDGRLFALKPNGDTLWIAVEPSLSYTTSSPVVGDIDGDSRDEIIVTTGVGKVTCVDDSGKVRWSIALKDTPFYSSPALVDMNKDGYLDIILTAGNKIYALNHNGAYLPGFPINTGASEAIQSSPVIGDIDGDGNPEIVVGSPDDKLLIYQNDGEAKPGFPLSMAGKAYSTPALADLDDDGHIEIIVGCDDGKLYVWSLPQSYGELYWPMLHNDEANNGIYTMPVEHPQVAADIFLKSDLYIYPNPVSRNGGKIRYFSGKADNVNIKIINVAGDVIKEFDGKIGENAPEDVDLPLSGITSGLYLCRVEVVKDGEIMVRFKKFTVIK